MLSVDNPTDAEFPICRCTSSAWPPPPVAGLPVARGTGIFTRGVWLINKRNPALVLTLPATGNALHLAPNGARHREST